MTHKGPRKKHSIKVTQILLSFLKMLLVCQNHVTAWHWEFFQKKMTYVWHTMTHHDMIILVIFILFMRLVCITCMYRVVFTWSFWHILWDYKNELELKNKRRKLWKFSWDERAFELHTVRSLIYNNLTNSPSI